MSNSKTTVDDGVKAVRQRLQAVPRKSTFRERVNAAALLAFPGKSEESFRGVVVNRFFATDAPSKKAAKQQQQPSKEGGKRAVTPKAPRPQRASGQLSDPTKWEVAEPPIEFGTVDRTKTLGKPGKAKKVRPGKAQRAAAKEAGLWDKVKQLEKEIQELTAAAPPQPAPVELDPAQPSTSKAASGTIEPTEPVAAPKKVEQPSFSDVVRASEGLQAESNPLYEAAKSAKKRLRPGKKERAAARAQGGKTQAPAQQAREERASTGVVPLEQLKDAFVCLRSGHVVPTGCVSCGDALDYRPREDGTGNDLICPCGSEKIDWTGRSADRKDLGCNHGGQCPLVITDDVRKGGDWAEGVLHGKPRSSIMVRDLLTNRPQLLKAVESACIAYNAWRNTIAESLEQEGKDSSWIRESPVKAGISDFRSVGKVQPREKNQASMSSAGSQQLSTPVSASENSCNGLAQMTTQQSSDSSRNREASSSKLSEQRCAPEHQLTKSESSRPGSSPSPKSSNAGERSPMVTAVEPQTGGTSPGWHPSIQPLTTSTEEPKDVFQLAMDRVRQQAERQRIGALERQRRAQELLEYKQRLLISLENWRHNRDETGRPRDEVYVEPPKQLDATGTLAEVLRLKDAERKSVEGPHKATLTLEQANLCGQRGKGVNLSLIGGPQRAVGPFGKTDNNRTVTDAEKERLLRPLLRDVPRDSVITELANHLHGKIMAGGRDVTKMRWLAMTGQKWLAQFDLEGVSEGLQNEWILEAAARAVKPTKVEDKLWATAMGSDVRRSAAQWREQRDTRWFSSFRNWLRRREVKAVDKQQTVPYPVPGN